VRGYCEPPIEFEFYFLRKEVYANAAAGASMGLLDWKVVLPGREQLHKLGADYWKSYLDRPRAAICLATKPLPN